MLSHSTVSSLDTAGEQLIAGFERKGRRARRTRRLSGSITIRGS